MAFNRTPPLDEARVKKMQAEIEAFIDARVEDIRKTCPGVPPGAIRNTIVRTGCLCGAFLEIQAKDAAREDAA